VTEAAPRNSIPQLEKFELLEEIGHGGMATVFRAVDNRLGREVAVKIIHRHLRENKEVATRFLAEARAAAKLKHRGIVEVYDVSAEEDRERYLVVELVRGCTLRKVLVEHREMPAEVGVAIAIELCEAIEHAHASGIIHRDIKPENVLVGRTPQGFALRLIDFGIAKANDGGRETRAGAVMGSLHAMAPEQFVDASTVDARADIYGLGCTLYEALTRRPPFTHDNEVRMLLAHLSESAPSPREFNPLVTESLAAVVLRAIAKAPSDRYATCTAFAAALRGAVA